MQNNKQNALEGYIEVNVRIQRFWEKFPAGRISTEIYSWVDGVVVVKAAAYRDIKDEFPAATGFAYEREGSTFINKTSALENCESSAVGRALAILGFEIKKSVASKEEVANAMHQQKQPNAMDLANQTKSLVREAYIKIHGSTNGMTAWATKMNDDGVSLEGMLEYLQTQLESKGDK